MTLLFLQLVQYDFDLRHTLSPKTLIFAFFLKLTPVISDMFMP